jgi:hypothetical protein
MLLARDQQRQSYRAGDWSGECKLAVHPGWEIPKNVFGSADGGLPELSASVKTKQGETHT